ncbi:MAG: hypothetical protein ABJE66_17120 [Deltaproteobacteria bacterium]
MRAVLLVVAACAHSNAPAPAVPSAHNTDFDFEMGTWHTHLKRLVHPLTGSTTWVEMDGTSIIRTVWGGRANLVELEVTGANGQKTDGLSLRLYDPTTKTWSLNYANAAMGTMTAPAIGTFNGGRGEFYDHEIYDGRTVYVRGVFSDITRNSYRFEQAFSTDEGKTWELNWVAVDTRIPD